MARWKIDPAHSNAEFVVRHMMISKVRGTFENIEGYIDFDEQNPENSYVEATIDVNTINTRNEQRDNHLRSADFFDVANYPTMTFKSTKVEVTGENTGRVTGELTIRGVTKEVTFDVEYYGAGPSPFGDVRAGFSGTTKINREDWGLTWNMALETGGVLISKEVTIEVNIEVIQEAATV